ncbi:MULTISPECIES: O-methyltransferase [Paenibacillus]|uniref:O-methyltransferase n=1 Tax=Paenibacillus campinasensis TaxID=66347 RepID=A0A268EXS1_9BACL|nr:MULTISPECIES: O-methyltransferase [Paenibacillus]MUG66457.1 O-methyltransferase [Paenibacillus campinasensis]PAD77925.1 O-methyltransferase [Paenibacillus campinasensis]PAK52993.1 O-methyltransferase [Paenibacillus sp. 7541]
MIQLDQLSLARQLDIVFKELEEELAGLNSGTVFVQIRNNVIGKFGIRHNPVQGRNGFLDSQEPGLNEAQQLSFRAMALESLKHKRRWTHGEISYEFMVRQGTIVVDAILESNYNMANLMIRYPRHTYAETVSES